MSEFLEQGEHVLCDMWDVDAMLLNDEDFLRTILTSACQLSGATVLSVQSHKFDPAGCTLLIALSESHCSLHTYVTPGKSTASGFLDFYTCGINCKPQHGTRHILDMLNVKDYNIKVVKRGYRDGIEEINS